MNTVAILLSAFVLSFVALLVFIWSQRRGLFDRRSRGAEVIFAAQEIGRLLKVQRAVVRLGDSEPDKPNGHDHA